MSDVPSPQMILEILLDLQQGQRHMREELRGEIITLRNEVRERFDRLETRVGRIEARQGAMEALLRQHTRRLDTLTIDLANVRRDVAALRIALQDYHGAVMGHGMHLSELDERIRRIEEHLGLSRM
jgi:predicted  nucleic acid-binding Zn-ribbon protein